MVDRLTPSDQSRHPINDVCQKTPHRLSETDHSRALFNPKIKFYELFLIEIEFHIKLALSFMFLIQYKLAINQLLRSFKPKKWSD